MAWTAGPLWASAVLLAAAGVAKVWRPAATVAALRAARLPASGAAVRLLGLVEAAAGVAAAVSGAAAAAAAVAVF